MELFRGLAPGMVGLEILPPGPHGSGILDLLEFENQKTLTTLTTLTTTLIGFSICCLYP